MYAQVLVHLGELDLSDDDIADLLDLLQEVPDDRVGTLQESELGVPLEDRELVDDIVPGDAVEQVQFRVRVPERFVDVDAAGYIPVDAPVPEEPVPRR